MSENDNNKPKKPARRSVIVPPARPSEVRDSIRELEAEFYRNYIEVTRENRETTPIKKRADNIKSLLSEYEELDKKATKMVETGQFTVRGLLSREKLIMRKVQDQVDEFDEQVEEAKKLQAKRGKKRKTFPDEYAWCSSKTGKNPSVSLTVEFDDNDDIVFVDKHINWDEPDEPDFTEWK